MNDSRPASTSDTQLSSPFTSSELEAALDKLLGDPDFLHLKHKDERSNLFRTLGTSHTELWHSAFLKWLLDPASDHGLGDFPLKRFLAAVVGQGVRKEGHEACALTLDLADIERIDLTTTEFSTEYSIPPPGNNKTKGSPSRLDLYGWIGLTGEEGRPDDASSLLPLQIVIENKIRAREHSDQTVTYFEWAEAMNYTTSIYVFLTVNDEEPKHPAFLQINYQCLYLRVLKPVLAHPNLPVEARFLVRQYMENLTDTSGRGAMAEGDLDLCKRLYEAHRKVFDAVFMANRNETPALRTTRTPQRYSVFIRDLVNKGLIAPGQRLFGTNKKDRFEAELLDEAGALVIRSLSLPEVASENPSRTASVVLNRPTNGWAFWKVQDGAKAGLSLAELREEYLRQTAEA